MSEDHKIVPIRALMAIDDFIFGLKDGRINEKNLWSAVCKLQYTLEEIIKAE